jgi:hypothetical protein
MPKLESKSTPYTPATKSASLCREPSHTKPGQLCGKPVLAKRMCRYHYDKQRLHKIRGTSSEPLNRKSDAGNLLIVNVKPALRPSVARVMEIERAKGRTAYEILNAWIEAGAALHPEYVDLDTLKARAVDVVTNAPDMMMDMARVAAASKPNCKCGACTACRARDLLNMPAAAGA